MINVRTNVSALKTLGFVQQNSSALNRTMERLSTGLRITRAGDDPAGLSIANRLRSDTASLKVAQRNITEGLSILQIAEDAASDVENVLVRMKELAIRSASDTSASERATIQAEFDTLVAEIDRIVGSTKYQDEVLLDGSFSGTIQVGATGDAVDQISVALANLSAVALGVGTDTDSDGMADTFLDISTDATTAAGAIADIDAALGTVRSALQNIGVQTNRLNYAASNLSTRIENYQASESAIRDADMAAEVAEMTKGQILQQTSIAMLAQANSAPQAVLSLLR